MGRTAISIFFCLLLACGCVKIPTDEANCRMLETPCIDTEEALGQSGFILGDFPDPCWWEMFNDSQLTCLIERALEESPTMAKVAATVRAADAEASIQQSKLFPTLGINSWINYQDLGKYNFDRAYAPNLFPAHIDDYHLTLDISYEFDFWGKNRNTYRAAIGEAKAQLAEQQSAILLLTTAVTSAYFKLQAEMQQLCLFQQQKKIFSDLFSLSQIRQENAIDSTSQVLETSSELLTLDQSIEFAMARVEITRHLLNMLIGQGPNLCEEVKAVCLNSKITFPLPCNISSELLTRRADLMAQLWRIEAAAHLVGAAKAEFFPRIDLLAVLGLEGVFSEHFFSWGSRLRQVMPGVYLPIFTGGRLRANLRQKRAEFEEMIYSYNESVLSAAAEVADQIVTLKTVNENLKSEGLLLKNKTENRSLAYSRYQNAIANFSQYLTVAQELLEEEQKNIALQFQQRIAVVQLIKALGGGYCSMEVPLGCQ